MDASNALGFLQKALPWIGAAATGNVPMLVGMAAKAIGGAIGSDVTETADGIAAAVAGATPDQLAAIKKADQDFALQMQALGYKNVEALAQLSVDNTKDARAMQVATRSPVPAVLAILVTLGFFGVLVGMMTGSLKVTDNQALLIMLGALGAAWGNVVNYYFGSSAG